MIIKYLPGVQRPTWERFKGAEMHEHMFWLLILFGTSQLQANFSIEHSFCSTARITHRMKINQNPFPFIFQKYLFIPCNSLHCDRLQHLGCKQAAANTRKTSLKQTLWRACRRCWLSAPGRSSPRRLLHLEAPSPRLIQLHKAVTLL